MSAHTSSIQAGHATHRGRTHAENEDALFIDRNRGLFLLADGMSGCRGGVASNLAVRTAYEYLRNRIDAGEGKSGLAELLADAFTHTHDMVRKEAGRDRKLGGMGTTLLILMIQGIEACITHVGDSRAYLVGREIRRLTKDHTMDGCAANDAMLRELFSLSRKRMLAQAVGASEKVDHETVNRTLLAEDRILLCTDGLTDMLSENTIKELIAIHRDDLQAAADTLIEAANKMGGRDNISVILIKAA